MKRPSFQFYPTDWLGNSNLRRCTHAEKGVWMDVMCLMHDSEEYGILRWSLKEIAQAVGCKLADLKSLVTKSVLKGSDTELTESLTYTPVSGRRKGPMVTLIDITKGPLWYSSRMVIDEYKRCARAGVEGSPSHSPNPPFGECNGDGFDASPNPSPSRARPHAGGRPSSSSSSSSKPTTGGKPPFVGGSRAQAREVALGTAVPVDFEPDLSHRGIAHNMGLDLKAERDKFVDHYAATGKVFEDWQAKFRNWLRNANKHGDSKFQRQGRYGPVSTTNLTDHNRAAAERARVLLFGDGDGSGPEEVMQ